ncbi:CLUMA_CG010080, isoform A [Clunio marinus]|uniref:CLUMA_CG010080, isoform A n=1 Tax=Clunio marinus TaxID=568069 RepID=A0A1J1I8W3_9DIPT|nr:CLUMA_CG010080, isoform A [Clunio marinus]
MFKDLIPIDQKKTKRNLEFKFVSWFDSSSKCIMSHIQMFYNLMICCRNFAIINWQYTLHRQNNFNQVLPIENQDFSEIFCLTKLSPK